LQLLDVSVSSRETYFLLTSQEKILKTCDNDKDDSSGFSITATPEGEIVVDCHDF
jgi:hypothetical protein